MYTYLTALKCGITRCYTLKPIRITKITLILLLTASFKIFAAGFSQEVSINVKNMPVKEVLNQLTQQTGYNFICDAEVIKGTKLVTIHANNIILSKVLDKCFANQSVDIIFDNEHTVIIKPKALVDKPLKTTLAIPVTGKVVDDKGVPLPGVSVQIKGTTTGTVTDLNGGFAIRVPDNSGVLVFSFIGFVSQEISIGNKTVINVTLSESSKSLNEVVVVGYGTKKKSDLTGSVASISSEDIVKSKAPNAQEALQGRLPGVDVKRTSGKPGADMTVEIRGVNSIYGNTQPLYVVDGIPVSSINDINPSDIERMDVLKDASSTAIFGSRGANGVVIVTTKRGTKGQTKINYDGYVGIVNAYNLPKMTTGPEFVNYAREFYKTLGANATPAVTYTDANIFSPTELANISSGNYTNWINLIKHNGLQTNHNLSITGGDEKSTYFLSAGFQDYEGAIKVENTKKYTLKVGLDKTFNNWFKLGASMYGTYADYNLGSGEVFRSAYRLRPTGSAYNTNGSDRFFTYETETQITNPLFDFVNDIRINQYVRVLPNIYTEIGLIKGLKFRSSFTPDITFQRSGTYTDTYTKTGAGTRPNSATNGANHIFNYTLDNLLIYNKEIGTDHKFDFTLGNSLNYYQTDNNLISVSGLPYRSLWYNLSSATAVTINGATIQPSTVVSSNYTQQNISSFFFRANYTLKNRYLFTATGRADGNSIFADGHKWGFFPSAAFGWIASEESFIKNISLINFLKFRFSYGKSGNAALFGTYFYPYVTQSSVATSYYDFNGSTANGSTIVSLANKDLTWEKTSEYNAGMELNILKSRIGLTVDYYNKTAKGTLLPQLIPAASGFTTVVANVGSVRNSGVEIGLNTTNIMSSNFGWTTNINFSRNKNQIIDLFGNGANDVAGARFIGQKARVIYDYKVIGVWQTSEATQAATYGEKPGQYKIQDTNNDGKITADDRVILGSDIPDWFGGITNTFNYKNFDLGFTVYTRQGTLQSSTFLQQYLNGDQGRARFNAYQRDYWTPTNPSNIWANNAIETDATRRAAALYQNSSYTKISNITLGYTLPKNTLSKISIKNLRIYATAYNPFIFTKFIGWDPETADLSSFGLQDFRTRTFILGFNITL